VICLNKTQTSKIENLTSGGVPVCRTWKISSYAAYLQTVFDQSIYADAMRNCDHAFSPDHPNIYHLEGDVKAHTDRTITEMENILAELKPDTAVAESMFLAAVGHDFGKIATRAPIPDKKRVRFANHPQFSGVLFYQFLSENGLADHLIHNEMLYPLLVGINLHDDSFAIYSNPNPLSDKMLRKWGALFSFNPILLPLLAAINRADDLGRISENPMLENQSHYPLFFDRFHDPIDVSRPEQPLVSSTTSDTNEVVRALTEKPTLLLMSGLPGSGKSSLVTQITNNLPDEAYLIVSLDKVVKEIAREANISYEEAHDNPDMIDAAHKRLQSNVADHLGSNQPYLIVLDKTHLSVKSRNREMTFIEDTINRLSKNGKCFPDYRSVCVSVVSPYSLCKERAKTRATHKVTENVVDAMASSFTLPYYGERAHLIGHRRKSWSYDHILIQWTAPNGEITFQEYKPPTPEEVIKQVDLNKIARWFQSERT